MITAVRARGKRGFSDSRHQSGMTLMEAMISLALSLVVTSAMVVLMANSLGTATRTIQMAQLTDELRNPMSMVTRDVRRANYSANAAYCFANSDCGLDGSANQVGDIVIVNNDCLIFNLDRNQDGDATTDDAGGFRRNTIGPIGFTIGFIEIWVGDESPDCAGNSADWVAVTDPELVDVTAFFVDDGASFSGELVGKDETLTQRTRRIQIQIQGQLIRDNTIVRRIEDSIKVRNDLITTTPTV